MNDFMNKHKLFYVISKALNRNILNLKNQTKHFQLLAAKEVNFVVVHCDDMSFFNRFKILPSRIIF